MHVHQRKLSLDLVGIGSQVVILPLRRKRLLGKEKYCIQNNMGGWAQRQYLMAASQRSGMRRPAPWRHWTKEGDGIAVLTGNIVMQ
ncbi:hypothetical protein IGS61_02685 [Janthinobacterium sp. FW305-129]|nr:hypothetical protein [Janthinobacterium sp. FW305-129]